MDSQVIKNAVDLSQRAQRNYDLSKTISTKDLETLMYAACNSPSKQNEIHFELRVYTEKSMIESIYNHTKKFTMGRANEVHDPNKGEEWLYQNSSVTNSQILANALFVYIDHDTKAKGATHMRKDDEKSMRTLNEQKHISIGVSIGELILSANLLGYRTGLCSGFKESEVKKVLNTEKRIRMLVGIGYPTEKNRRLHARTYNRDVPEDKRNGPIDEPWMFPTYNKDWDEFIVSLNGGRCKFNG